MSWKNIRIKMINAWLSSYCRYKRINLNRPEFSERAIERIVIFSNRRLGDVMFCTPAIKAIRERYPQADISLVTSKAHSQWIEPGKYINRVFSMDNNIKDMFAVIRQLKEISPQVSVILHARAPYDVIASVMAGCHTLLKDYYANEPAGMDKWLFAVTRGRGKHIIQRKLELVSRLDCQTIQTDMFLPVEVQAIKAGKSTPLIGFQMGASKPGCRWPVENFVALTEKIVENCPGSQIVLIGAPEERELAERFFSLLPDELALHVQNLIGVTTMKQLINTIAGFDLLVTNDTGPLHIAVAARIKTVCLFSLTNAAENGPCQDALLHHIIQAEVDVKAVHPMQSISVEQVTTAVFKQLVA
ncbi:glycosyltransferase family 9 protein [Erwinia sp. D4-22]